MAGAMRHRGPDGSGIHQSERVGFAHVRLSIVDLSGGAQPLRAQSGRYTIVYNGEVYNHAELRSQLEKKGHHFQTRSDTEVVVAGYVEWGVDVLDRLHGQFAFAIHDQHDDSVFLARDRFGVRPLFYALQHGTLVFGSEAKAIFASGLISSDPDPRGLDQVMTFWAARAPLTVFKQVRALEPGSCALWRAGRLQHRRWWRPEYEESAEVPRDVIDQLDHLLFDSVQERLRADVPVGAYVSGGIDSAVTATLAQRASPHQLRSFSITFEDPSLDEAEYQAQVIRSLDTLHHARRISAADIANVFPDVIRHAETPLLRTAPAPMYLLARLTRESDIKVVLTGEGADELFLGYDLFREASVRRFALRAGNESWRARLFDRLYPYQTTHSRGDLWQKWFLSASDIEDPLFSHMPRFLLAGRIKEFYSRDFKAQLGDHDPLAELRDSLPADFSRWSHANQAAYLELTTLLEPYLLSSQGDRMSLAHGVEGRYPFLDHRLFRWSASLPVRAKLRALSDKRVLRRWAQSHLPRAISNRPKQPYRAPDAAAFFGAHVPSYVEELLQPTAITDAGFFDSAGVSALVRRCRAGRAVSVRENQALVAILSTQLWYREFRDAALGRPLIHAVSTNPAW